MIRGLVTVAAAALLAGTSTIASAQNWQPPPQPQSHPNTKVYSYQKSAAPKPAKPGASVANQPNGSAVIGSQKWWEIMGRTAGGDGS